MSLHVLLSRSLTTWQFSSAVSWEVKSYTVGALSFGRHEGRGCGLFQEEESNFECWWKLLIQVETFRQAATGQLVSRMKGGSGSSATLKDYGKNDYATTRMKGPGGIFHQMKSVQRERMGDSEDGIKRVHIGCYSES
jgi:hypothetical protein